MGVEFVDGAAYSLLNQYPMLRPSFLSSLALVAFAAVAFTGCRTMYSEMYSPKRNRFVPEKEEPKTLDLLPPPAPAPVDATPPGLPPAVPPPVDAPAAPMAPTLPPL
jgi:hypothetical protein